MEETGPEHDSPFAIDNTSLPVRALGDSIFPNLWGGCPKLMFLIFLRLLITTILWWLRLRDVIYGLFVQHQALAFSKHTSSTFSVNDYFVTTVPAGRGPQFAIAVAVDVEARNIGITI